MLPQMAMWLNCEQGNLGQSSMQTLWTQSQILFWCVLNSEKPHLPGLGYNCVHSSRNGLHWPLLWHLSFLSIASTFLHLCSACSSSKMLDTRERITPKSIDVKSKFLAPISLLLEHRTIILCSLVTLPFWKWTGCKTNVLKAECVLYRVFIC